MSEQNQQATTEPRELPFTVCGEKMFVANCEERKYQLIVEMFRQDFIDRTHGWIRGEPLILQPPAENKGDPSLREIVRSVVNKDRLGREIL